MAKKIHASGEVSRKALMDTDFHGRVRLAIVKAALDHINSTTPQVSVYAMKVINGDFNGLMVSLAVGAECGWPDMEVIEGEDTSSMDDETLIRLINNPDDFEQSIFYKLAMADEYKQASG